MRLTEFLNSVDLGAPSAERDEALDEVFVQTQDFRAISTGRADLITGAKGSGKSAVFLTLLNHGASHGIVIERAQNLRGEVIFGSDLPPEGTDELVSDGYYKERWTAHSLAVAANAVVRDKHGDPRIEPLLEALQHLDLMVGDSDVAKIWQKSGMRRWIGTAFSVDEEDCAKPDINLEDLAKRLADTLELVDYRIWVMYDRLDDVHNFNPARERAMLRGLLQATVSLLGISRRLSLKIFLRDDILDRITQERPIRNIDHLSRIELAWNAREIMRMVAYRIVRTPFAEEAINGALDLGNGRLSDSQVDQLWRSLVSARPSWLHFDKTGNHLERVYQQFFLQVADAKKRYNPRVVVDYLRYMLTEQATIASQGEDPELPIDAPIFSEVAQVKAYQSVSSWRLESYIYAEFQNLRPHLELLKNQRGSFAGRAGLLYALQLPDSDSAREIIRELRFCGVLEYNPRENLFRVTKLYRYALGCKVGSVSPPTVDEPILAESSVEVEETISIAPADLNPSVGPDDVKRLAEHFGAKSGG